MINHSAAAARLSEERESMIGRRAAPRVQVNVPATFVVAGKAIAVTLLDVSASGARLQIAAPPPAGLYGILKWEDLDCRCVVVWSHGQTFGVRFIEDAVVVPERLAPSPRAGVQVQVPAGSAAQERRAAARSKVNYPCEVRQADRWIKTYLKNISANGFEVIWFPGCRQERPLFVRGERLPRLQGSVVWTDNLTIGCKLETPLHEGVLAHILGRLWGE